MIVSNLNLWDKWFTCIEISGAESRTINWGSVTIKIQPGFDPFKISFSTSHSNENISAGNSYSTPTNKMDFTEITKDNLKAEILADKYKKLGDSLIEYSQTLK